MTASIPDLLLELPGWAALLAVFLLPALESSAFIGFVFPGEIAVILGGVAAAAGRMPLPVMIVAAILGAIIGDSVGYAIGKRWGDQMLHGTIGRLPIVRHELQRHLESVRPSYGNGGHTRCSSAGSRRRSGSSSQGSPGWPGCRTRRSCSTTCWAPLCGGRRSRSSATSRRTPGSASPPTRETSDSRYSP